MLDNEKSPRIKKVASLNRKKSRTDAGLFLVEGPQAVRELLNHRPELVKEIFIDGSEQGFLDLERISDEKDIPITYATERVLKAISDTVQPQGIVAVARMWHDPLFIEEALKGLNTAKLVAIMHEVRDPGNAGAVIRAADAAGADAVILTGNSIDIYNPKVVRSTTGSLFHLPVLNGISLEDAAAAVRLAGMSVIAADVNGDNLDPAVEALKHRTAWLFGNEARGLTTTEREEADSVLRLPIFGAAESLNLATAASVCLYTSAFAQR